MPWGENTLPRALSVSQEKRPRSVVDRPTAAIGLVVWTGELSWTPMIPYGVEDGGGGGWPCTFTDRSSIGVTLIVWVSPCRFTTTVTGWPAWDWMYETSWSGEERAWPSTETNTSPGWRRASLAGPAVPWTVEKPPTAPLLPSGTPTNEKSTQRMRKARLKGTAEPATAIESRRPKGCWR